MEELKDLIASVVAYIANKEREEAAEYDREYVYVPVRVTVPVEERADSEDSVTWRMY